MQFSKSQLLEIFLEETDEYLDILEQNLLELEKSQGIVDDALIHNIFRAVHSIKGNAPMVGLKNIANLAHNMETCFELAREKIAPVDKEMISALFAGYDKLTQMCKDTENSENYSIGEESERFLKIIERYSGKIKSKQPKIQEKQQLNKTNKVTTSDKKSKSAKSMRVPVKLLDDLMLNCGELVLVRNQLLAIVAEHGNEIPELIDIAKKISSFTYLLQEEVISTRMQPISVLFEKFPRLMDELNTKLNKKINLELTENEVQIDRSFVESLSDALIHIIRNSADHGIEDVETRLKKGKNEYGTITITALQKGSSIYINIHDDGAGFDIEKIISKAVEKKLIDPANIAVLTNQQLYDLAFKPGFTTSDNVSTISGRGVGLDVVKHNIEKLGGTITVSSNVGLDSTIVIQLPLTVSITNALIIKTADTYFAIPEASVKEIGRVKFDDITEDRRIEIVKKHLVLQLRKRLVPLVSLRELLGLPPIQDKHHIRRIVILKYNKYEFGLLVDDFITYEEVVIKPIPSFFKEQDIYIGTTILGNGKIALILDTMNIVANSNLNFEDIKTINKNQIEHEDEKLIKKTKQLILVFENAKSEYFALPLEMIKKVVKIEDDKIIKVGNCEYAEFDGNCMQFLRLENYIPVDKKADGSNTLLIVNSHDKPFGILTYRIFDNFKVVLNINTEHKNSDCMLGSAIINQIFVTIPDISTLETKLKPKLIPQNLDNIKNILMIDNSSLFSSMDKEYLMSIGYNIEIVANDNEAKKRLSEKTYSQFIKLEETKL